MLHFLIFGYAHSAGWRWWWAHTLGAALAAPIILLLHTLGAGSLPWIALAAIVLSPVPHAYLTGRVLVATRQDPATYPPRRRSPWLPVWGVLACYVALVAWYVPQDGFPGALISPFQAHQRVIEMRDRGGDAAARREPQGTVPLPMQDRVYRVPAQWRLSLSWREQEHEYSQILIRIPYRELLDDPDFVPPTVPHGIPENLQSMFVAIGRTGTNPSAVVESPVRCRRGAVHGLTACWQSSRKWEPPLAGDGDDFDDVILVRPSGMIGAPVVLRDDSFGTGFQDYCRMTANQSSNSDECHWYIDDGANTIHVHIALPLMEHWRAIQEHFVAQLASWQANGNPAAAGRPDEPRQDHAP